MDDDVLVRDPQVSIEKGLYAEVGLQVFFCVFTRDGRFRLSPGTVMTRERT